MKDLEDTLYYYENVAQAEDNLERTELLKKTKTKLRDVIANISRKIEGEFFEWYTGQCDWYDIVAIDYKIEKLQAEVMNVYNIPELQQHRVSLSYTQCLDAAFSHVSF